MNKKKFRSQTTMSPQKTKDKQKILKATMKKRVLIMSGNWQAIFTMTMEARIPWNMILKLKKFVS